jgi:hypothetical protein
MNPRTPRPRSSLVVSNAPAPLAAPLPVVVEEAARGLTKVYWTAQDKASFAEEAASHGLRESEYARFILNARGDPLLFLQLCRLRDPAFAQGLMGNAQDAGRVVELDKLAAELSAKLDLAARDRDDAKRRAEEAERRLVESHERNETLAGYVADLLRLQQANHERALKEGRESEKTDPAAVRVAAALAVGPLLRADLEARLMEGGASQPEASAQIAGLARAGVIKKGRDARYRLASPAREADAE